MNTEYHEQLSTGAAVVNDGDEYPTVRINPIGEGEITVGQSGEPTVWDRDTLKAAVEQNSLVDRERGVSEIVEGTGGVNPHHPIDEQVPPKAKLGKVPEWEYEEGVGPVAEVQLADKDIADRVELDLLDVSADLERELGEFDEELGARPVERILSMPRVTVVDRGASPSASIEPVTAEALGYNPEAGLVEQLASDGDAVRWESDGGGSREPADERYGVVVNPAPDDSERDWMVSVYQAREDYDGWEPRDETNPMADETLERVGPDGVASLPPVSQVMDIEEQNAPSDERADTRAGSQSQDQQPDDTSMSDDTTKEELREQLAAVKAEVNEKDEQIEDLQADKESLEEEKETLEETKEDLESENEELEENNETFQRALAQKYAEQSPMSAEKAMERLDVNDMVEDLDDGPDGEDDDRTPKERLSEQLASGLSLRGQNTEETQNGSLSDDELEEAEQLAGSVLSLDDIQRVNSEQLSKRDYVKREHDVDPAEYNTEDSLREALAAEGGD